MKTLFAAAVAVSLLTGTAATAYADNDHGRKYERRQDDHGKDRRDYRGRNDHGKDRKDYRGNDNRGWDRKDYRSYDRRDYGRDDRRYDRRDDRWDHGRRDYRVDRHDAYRAGYYNGRSDQRRYDRGRYIAPRGYYVRSWRHGDYLPRSYCETRYVVSDYHSYHLGAPPRGHHWVRVNNDVVLAAVASGLVVSVVNGLFY
ncbi:RcnB family protein [Steroidobacter sp.]|uniref:RcnB family protein n=1 Tax=Steroidobacter sp. TaxID=1978227 RepID=UPI001A375FED|nr:RcnB family protein [Steroidobacter sp.]MBL8271775.1 RcnB family protein [Steroidobacter sp.]